MICLSVSHPLHDSLLLFQFYLLMDFLTLHVWIFHLLCLHVIIASHISRSYLCCFFFWLFDITKRGRNVCLTMKILWQTSILSTKSFRAVKRCLNHCFKRWLKLEGAKRCFKRIFNLKFLFCHIKKGEIVSFMIIKIILKWQNIQVKLNKSS